MFDYPRNEYIYKCAYQENCGEDGYLDLLQEVNATSMRRTVVGMAPMCL